MSTQLNAVNKKLIFTVTSGRSGTDYLSRLLAAIPDVSSHHEPNPNFVQVMRRVQSDPAMAYMYLNQHKLPAIAQEPGKIYVETSHLTSKGFLEPMIRMGLRPSLIILRRPPREVAWSYLEKETVPTRTTLGIRYLFDPRDLGVLPLINWESASDYQLCFWYALEVERRQLYYTSIAKHYGLTVVDVTNTELNDWETYAQMLTDLGLTITEDVKICHQVISGKLHNRNVQKQPMPEGLAQEEEAIWDSVTHFDLALRDHVNRRYGHVAG